MDIHDLIQLECRNQVLKCPNHLHGASRAARRPIDVSDVSGVAYGNKRGESKTSREVLEGGAEAEERNRSHIKISICVSTQALDSGAW